MAIDQNKITNDVSRNHKFLAEMYNDNYFPKHLVEKGISILMKLCLEIEKVKPDNLPMLYQLTHAATDQFNELQEEFYENESEIETAARECIASDFEFIAKTYGFQDADIEELIETRDW